MICGYRNISLPNNHTIKIDKLHKYFELYQVFIKTFCARMYGYSLYIYGLQEQSTHFCLRVLKRYLEILRFFFCDILSIFLLWYFGPKIFWGIKTFWAQNITEEKSTKFLNMFELHQVLISPKMFWYLLIIYCWHTLIELLQLLPNFSTTLLILYHFLTLYKFLLVKIDSIPFLL